MHFKISNTLVCSCGLLLIIWIIIVPRNPCNMIQTLASSFTFSNSCSVYSTINRNIASCI